MRNKNQTAAIDWFIQRDWELAITLTFKKDCTEHRARKTMRRLWNGFGTALAGSYTAKTLKSKENELSEFVRLRKGRVARSTTTTLPPVHPLCIKQIKWLYYSSQFLHWVINYLFYQQFYHQNYYLLILIPLV